MKRKKYATNRMIIIMMYMMFTLQVLKHCATISSERLKDPKAHMSSGDAPSVICST